ncbi:methylenetetrahydrofolate reductase (NADPH) [Plodia interpunctella]|uniref:methylenetetrahydrofolate reductase (NADPH) n=1 Tax=Plodia interpunctella TaxID=58824 RepID=UPI00236843AC|nr:methylenetetrahydrofolate reductase (NADPH) [Plodia interpunctella]
MAKISDLIKSKKEFSFSFEVSPGLLEDTVDHLTVEPLFYSITWHAKGHQNKDMDTGPLKLARDLKMKGKNVLLHMSCDLLRKEYLDRVLKMLQEEGIPNLFLILGEKYDPTTSDFASTIHLIKYIRLHSSDYFCIAVAGDLGSGEQRLQSLKEKINAGADFIITQAFFDPIQYKNFYIECRKIGIEVPIVPGIFYFENKKQLDSFINLCKIKISSELIQKVENYNLEENLGAKVTKDIIDDINKDRFQHFHFFTLNKLESVSNFIQKHF